MGYAVVVGACAPLEQAALTAASGQANTQLESASLEALVARLEQQSGKPRSVLVSEQGDLKEVVARLREKASLLTVPVIAMVTHASEGTIGTAFADGADDVVVAGDRGALTRRFARLLAMKSGVAPTAPTGLALVASADAGRRRTLGQALRRAGVDALYASDASELVDRPALRAINLIVTDDTFPGGSADAIATVQKQTGNASLSALVVPDHGAARAVGYNAAANTHAQLLSLVEGVTRNAGADQRASHRLAYATLVSFRAAGSMQPTFGLSHNLSREGLFVRTLDPPKPGTIAWVELRVPSSDEVVHMRGPVVWCRDPGSLGATPFGFGLRLLLDQCPPPDRDAYLDAYAESTSDSVASLAS